jgi:hypothetical protein
MSFGLLKHFKDRKTSGETQVITTKHFKHVILGSDLGAILKLLELKKNYPEESIRLVSSRVLTRQMLIENYEFGVSQLRSEVAVQEIYKKHFNAKISPQNKEALFYKDGKFHEFGSRAKPMELLAGESFFTKKGYRISLESLFSADDWANLDQIISDSLEIRILDSIEKSSPTDLVEKTEWKIDFKDFSTINCEYLYLSHSPQKFLQHLANRDNMSPELIDACTSANIQSGLSVTWILNREVYADEQTLFIPQSMTHEWGHFIVEFEPFDHAQRQQVCHVLFLIHDEEPQTEDLGAKLRLMKRVLDRVFTDFDKSISKEYIRLDEEMFVSDLKESCLEQVGFDYPTLKFTGCIAPLAPELQSEKFLARTLLS